MLTPALPPYERPLADGLVVRSVTGMDDAERVAAFNGVIHGPGVVAMARNLLVDHPDTRPEHWLYVEEAATRAIVASLCLLPWTWRVDDLTIRAGEMGLVGTLEHYRRRGLIRVLDERFSTLLRDEGFLFSHIQGIPYFYRQFGYEYALPLEAHWRLELYRVPEPTSDAARFTFRRATDDDIPVLQRHYDATAQREDISAVRTAGHWRYLLGPSLATELAAETWLAVDESGATVGYTRIAEHGFGAGLIVVDSAAHDIDLAHAMLNFFKLRAVEREKPYVRLNLPVESTLVRLARVFGAHDDGTYAWQIRIPAPAALVRQLAPVLERRLASSPFAGLTRSLRVNLFRSSLLLDFVAGKLAHVVSGPPIDGGDLQLPVHLLAPLVLGQRSFDDLRRVYPDVSASGVTSMLVEELFPARTAFLAAPY